MATTVNSAFNEFMQNKVNLDPDIVSAARDSRDNLLDNISEFDNQDDFFDLCESFNLHFGSFARKTKCRELDDIDLMIGIAANGATYYPSDLWNNVRITASTNNPAQIRCRGEDGTLDSTKVINLFKKKLESVREYSRSDVHKNGEAVVLNLKSKEWSFDIVPCFHTVKEDDGRDYYLIPNGKGNWKKTDPTIDRQHVTDTNKEKNGLVLELIRLCKKWNKERNGESLPSYLLETMVVNYCDQTNDLNDDLKIRFRDALRYIANHILSDVQDIKRIQGNLNTLDYSVKYSLRNKAQSDCDKASQAIRFEIVEKDHKKSIKMWGEIYGADFPIFE